MLKITGYILPYHIADRFPLIFIHRLWIRMKEKTKTPQPIINTLRGAEGMGCAKCSKHSHPMCSLSLQLEGNKPLGHFVSSRQQEKTHSRVLMGAHINRWHTRQLIYTCHTTVACRGLMPRGHLLDLGECQGPTPCFGCFIRHWCLFNIHLLYRCKIYARSNRPKPLKPHPPDVTVTDIFHPTAKHFEAIFL